jgi:hypothetical protein
VLIPRDDGVIVSSVTAKRIWEAILSGGPGDWAPAVKNAKYTLSNSDVVVDGNFQMFTDKAYFQSSIERLNFQPVPIHTSVDRLSFKDDRSGMYLVLGLHETDHPSSHSDERLYLESMSWGIETILEHKSVVTFLLEFSRKQTGLSSPLQFLYNAFPTVFVESLCAHPRRIKEFILTQ